MRTAPGSPKYVVLNADESEPGTFSNRVLLEEDPFASVEAMTIAGLAVGAGQGYIYIRGEYSLAARRLTQAIAQARAAGYLGFDVLSTGTSFDIEVRRGGGAYICGRRHPCSTHWKGCAASRVPSRRSRSTWGSSANPP